MIQLISIFCLEEIICTKNVINRNLHTLARFTFLFPSFWVSSSIYCTVPPSLPRTRDHCYPLRHIPFRWFLLNSFQTLLHQGSRSWDCLNRCCRTRLHTDRTISQLHQVSSWFPPSFSLFAVEFRGRFHHFWLFSLSKYSIIDCFPPYLNPYLDERLLILNWLSSELNDPSHWASLHKTVQLHNFNGSLGNHLLSCIVELLSGFGRLKDLSPSFKSVLQT